MSNNPKIIFYPVDNGNMIFIKLSDKTTMLIDINIRKAASDDNKEEIYDVVTHLKDYLEKDSNGRYFLDAFILTHLDLDHIAGLQDNFHLGKIEDYSDKDKEKIIINETWSSERFWKRETEKITLSEDAKAFNKEMRRRSNLCKNSGGTIQGIGDRAIILGEDDDGLKNIIHNIGTSTSKINNKEIENFNLNILGPIEQQAGEDKECFDEKNRGSVILQFEVTVGSFKHKILLTGDAEVDVWEYMNGIYSDELLEYDILSVPHHCSWHSLSHDKDRDPNPQMSQEAYDALSHSLAGAIAISSSKQILDDENNPPHHRAKKEYIKIVGEDNFYCTGEYRDKDNVEPLVIELTPNGHQIKSNPSTPKTTKGTTESAKVVYPHGNR